jgi:hypothetical protein
MVNTLIKGILNWALMEFLNKCKDLYLEEHPEAREIIIDFLHGVEDALEVWENEC